MFVIVITCLTPETLKMLSFILVQVRDLMAHYWQPHIIRFFGGGLCNARLAVGKVLV